MTVSLLIFSCLTNPCLINSLYILERELEVGEMLWAEPWDWLSSVMTSTPTQNVGFLDVHLTATSQRQVTWLTLGVLGVRLWRQPNLGVNRRSPSLSLNSGEDIGWQLLLRLLKETIHTFLSHYDLLTSRQGLVIKDYAHNTRAVFAQLGGVATLVN